MFFFYWTLFIIRSSDRGSFYWTLFPIKAPKGVLFYTVKFPKYVILDSDITRRKELADGSSRRLFIPMLLLRPYLIIFGLSLLCCVDTLWIIATSFMATRLDDNKTIFRNTLYDFYLDNPPWLLWTVASLIVFSVNAYVTLTALAS